MSTSSQTTHPALGPTAGTVAGAISHDLALARALALATTGLAALIYCLICLGGLVRNAHAGLSCPDWPLCFGDVVPPMSTQVFLEWFHRLIAGTVSAVFLVSCATVFVRRELRKRYAKLCAFGIALLMAQVVLGGLTVLGLLSPKWVSSHLAVGMAFFGTVLVISMEIRNFTAGKAQATRTYPKLTLWAFITTGLLYGQIILGGLVSSHYAGLACPDFPMCNGQWLPPLQGLVLFHFIHRVGALVATLAVLSLAVASIKARVTPRARMALRLLPVLVLAQVCLGVGTVLFKLPLLLSVAHLGTAAALFGMLVVTSYELRRI